MYVLVAKAQAARGSLRAARLVCRQRGRATRGGEGKKATIVRTAAAERLGLGGSARRISETSPRERALGLTRLGEALCDFGRRWGANRAWVVPKAP